MPVFNNILAGAAGQTGSAAAAGPIKSVRFNNDDSAYLNRSATDSGGNVYKYTVSWWMKIGSIGTDKTIVSFATNNAVNGWTKIHLRTDNRLSIFGDSSGTALSIRPTMLFRDPSAWYHCVVSLDTTESTYSDQAKFYINGVQQTDFTGTLAFAQNTALSIGEATTHHVGVEPNSLGDLRNYFDGMIADLHVIEGQVKQASDFGAFDDNGVWQAAEYSGTYGNNGYHLFDFATETGVGNDASGNDNDFTVNNISTTAGVGNDVLFDVPTNGTQSDTGAGGEVSGNYCTWNPLHTNANLSDGNLKIVTNAAAYDMTMGTIGMSSGKWYWEGTWVSGDNRGWGVGTLSTPLNDYLGSIGSWGYMYTGVKVQPGNNQSSYGNTFAAGDIVSVAFDADNGAIWFAKNGVWQNSATQSEIEAGTTTNAAFTGLTNGPYFPYTSNQSSATGTKIGNFGQRAFAYTAPSGYKALCTTNLPTPTIADGSDYFDIKLWTGNSSTNAISGYSFSPDWVWIKSYSNAVHHSLFDTVREENKYLYSSLNSSEVTGYTDTLTSFDSDGFTLGADSSNQVNYTGYSYIGWAWDAGSSTESNTDGSITTSVRANQTAGFSIVSYTGTGANATIGHGLNVAPEFAIFKVRSTTNNWAVYHKSLGATDQIKLNQTASTSSSASFFQDTEPTSSVIYLGADSTANYSSQTMIAYCFAPVEGYSAFGSYEGNGSNDGTFVHTGFSVRWLLTKASSHGSDWQLWDSARQPYNVNANTLTPNGTNAETGSAGYAVDFLSNGFKFRNYGSSSNQSGYTYIWAAFASNPFQANGGLAR